VEPSRSPSLAARAKGRPLRPWLLVVAGTACAGGTPSGEPAPAAGGQGAAGATSAAGSTHAGGGTGAQAGSGAAGRAGGNGGAGAGTAGGSGGVMNAGSGGVTAAGGGAAQTGGAGSATLGGAGQGASGGSAGASAGSGSGSGSGGASAGSGSGSGSGSGGASAGAAGSGGSACAKAGLLLCDDFEAASAGTAPGAPWTTAVNGANGTVLIDTTTPAHSGTKSVHVASLGNYQTFLAVRGAPVFPAPSPALYARVFIRLGAPMTSGHNTYFKAGVADAISSNDETRVGVMESMLMINQPDGDRGFLSNEGYWTDQKPGVVIPEQTWTCIEGFFDPPNTTVDVWVNGKEVPDLHRTDWKQDALGAFHFGFEKYAGPDADVWYDDIAIGTAPIGCD